MTGEPSSSPRDECPECGGELADRPLALRCIACGTVVRKPGVDYDVHERICPDGAALSLEGEHFPCDAMNGMAPDCDSHEGWAHSNQKAGAIWK